jgi:hypothetical protein
MRWVFLQLFRIFDMNKTITTLLAAAGIAVAAPASAIIVGGIDFGPQGADPARTHLETTTLAQTLVNGNGQSATVYGFITTVNGDSTYCADNTANCGLYFVSTATGSQNFSPAAPGTEGYIEFTSTTTSVFFSNQPQLNLLSQDSPTNVAAIQAFNGGNPWVTLHGHNNLGGSASPEAVLNAVPILTGQVLSGSTFGLFDVSGPGDPNVINFLNANGTLDAANNPTDISLTGSFNNRVLNPVDVANGLTAGCADGSNAGAWCFQGSADLRGNTEIPEPSMLALVGIGLLGLGTAYRRRKA